MCINKQSRACMTFTVIDVGITRGTPRIHRTGSFLYCTLH